MAFIFRRELTIPLWTIAFLALALVAPTPAMPPLSFLLGIAVLALTMTAMVRWQRARPLIAILPVMARRGVDAGIGVTVMSPHTPLRIPHVAASAASDDALDLVRMDDDGGWQMTREADPIVLIPAHANRAC